MPPSSNLMDFNGGFSYIISSWLTEEGQKSTDMASYITTSCSTSSNILVFLVVALYNILMGIANKIALARVPTAC